MTKPPPSRICIVDDDRDFVEFLGQYLAGQGFPTADFGAAEDLLSAGGLSQYDFFILDLGLPGIDGIELIKLIRARSDAGILVISGRMGADAFNLTIAAGADMYINKPVRFGQVLSAITSVNRRLPLHLARTAEWILHPDRRELVAPGGASIDLTPMEIQLMQRLCEEPLRPVSRQDLARAAGILLSETERNIEAAIFHLRRKIEQRASQPSPIKTVHGTGYTLLKSVQIVQ